VEEALARRGVFFLEYPWEPGYGMTLLTPAWVDAAVEGLGERMFFRERAWDAHQDIYGIAATRSSGQIAE
jgi:hypothetical protein